MLNARLTQWCFINAKAERAFECQKRTAEVKLILNQFLFESEIMLINYIRHNYWMHGNCLSRNKKNCQRQVGNLH